MIKYILAFGLFFVYPCYSSDWTYYIGGSLQTNVPFKFHRLGWNGDKLCYSRNFCPKDNKGYAWIYEILSGVMSGLGFQAGVKAHPNLRFGLSADGFLSLEESETKFLLGYWLKENKNPFMKGTFSTENQPTVGGTLNQKTDEDSFISSENSFSDFQLATGLVNAYFDLPLLVIDKKFIYYVGAGLGYSLVRANIKYHSKYKDSSLDSEQEASFEDFSLSYRLIHGLSYALSESWSYGLEASYTVVQDASNKLPYKKHPNQKNNTTILRDISYWTVALNVNYLL